MRVEGESEKALEILPDRRRHLRYRFSIPISIRCADGVEIPGITIEISESGLSAITADPLRLNDLVELEPIAAGRVRALVRHNVGRVYGFEFLKLSAEQVLRIKESCKMLSRYRAKSMGI
jgi:PilZ domain